MKKSPSRTLSRKLYKSTSVPYQLIYKHTARVIIPHTLLYKSIGGLMKRHSHVPLLFWILFFACVLPIVYAAIIDQEEFVLLGLIPAVFLVIALIVFKVRSRQFEKILRKEAHLLYFEYNSGEVEEIINHELPKLKKASYILALLFGICLLIIAVPLSLMMQKNDPSSPVWEVYASTMLIPALGVFFAKQAVARKVRKTPCVTAVGPDYILIANRYPGINDYGKLKLDHASFSKSEPGAMRWLRLDYSFVAMKNATRIQKSVEVPVPHDKAAEADYFVRQFAKQGKAIR